MNLGHCKDGSAPAAARGDAEVIQRRLAAARMRGGVVERRATTRVVEEDEPAAADRQAGLARVQRASTLRSGMGAAA